MRGLILVCWWLALAAVAWGAEGPSPILGPGVAGPPMPLGCGFVPTIAADHVPKSSRDVVRRLNRLPDVAAERGGPGTAVVFYDADPIYSWVGELYAQQLANLLSHFKLKVTRMPVSEYRAGLLARYDVGFYLGVIYDAPLPATFRADVLTSPKPFAWLGFNLWKVAWADASGAPSEPFVTRTGIKFVNLDGRGFPTVTYKNVPLSKSPLDSLMARVEVLDTRRATTVATATGPSGQLPYIVRGGSDFWFIADNPMGCVDSYRWNDRLLAFADVLHDITRSGVTTNNQAIIRIEDVRPIEDQVRLRAVADVCAEEGVPFSISVIPDYRDPEGKWPNGPRTLTPIESPGFADTLHYMEDRGATVLMHGVTHQMDTTPNPWNCVSAQDFEFMRVTVDAAGVSRWEGPVPGDSGRWARRRVDRGRELMRDIGFDIKGWVTPHYAASPVDYAEFTRIFDFSLCRGAAFSLGKDGRLYVLQQLTPYPITDVMGMKRYPETLGYVEPGGGNGFAGSGAELAQRATALKVVRDGWAGCYFHPFLDIEELRALLRGVKAAGFTFVGPRG